MKTLEMKLAGAGGLEIKAAERNGVPVAVVAGYIATWDEDRGGDRFEKSAFDASIKFHRDNNRPIRLKDHHGRTIGAFPIESVSLDDNGLKAVGEINLDLEQGRDAHALIKQGAVSEFSIGYYATRIRWDDDTRVIEEAEIVEGSVVDDPMNYKAKILEVKSFKADEIKTATTREIEHMLRETGAFSKDAAKALISAIKSADKPKAEPDNGASELLREIKSLTSSVSGK